MDQFQRRRYFKRLDVLFFWVALIWTLVGIYSLVALLMDIPQMSAYPNIANSVVLVLLSTIVGALAFGALSYISSNIALGLDQEISIEELKKYDTCG